jgi:hypothetical protein
VVVKEAKSNEYRSRFKIKKREYLKNKINELKTNSKDNSITDLFFEFEFIYIP